MNGDVDEDNSDIEIIDNGALRATFYRLQFRLISELHSCGQKIPRAWEKFKEFINEVIEWHPSEELMRSTWLKLSCAEKLLSNISDCVEISDDESPTKAANNSLQEESNGEQGQAQEVNTQENPCISQPGCSQVTSPTIVQQNSTKGTSKRKKSLIEKAKPNAKFPRNTSPKKSVRGSNPMTEEEAETLREQLLIDKIIELELPKVIKSVLQNNVPTELPTIVKRSINRSRRAKKRKSN